MDLKGKVCSRCGRLIKAEDGGICSLCRERTRDVNRRISEFLEENPNSCIVDITGKLNVSVKNVNEFIAMGGAGIESKKGEWKAPRVEECEERERRAGKAKVTMSSRRKRR